MPLGVNQSVGNSYSCENFNETKQDPIETLPYELVLEVFSHLNFATLGTIFSVSKKWKRLASDETLWKKSDVYDKAISSKNWAQWFGDEAVKDEDLKEEWESLPWNIARILESRCPIFPEKRVMDTHMLVRLPKTLNGGLTLKSLGELAKKYFSDSNSGYRFIWAAIVQELGDKSIDKSHWVLMTKDVLPGSKNKSYGEQQKIVADLAEKSLISYEVPETLESAVCILSQYFGSNIRLFSDNPWTYTRCKDKVQGYQTVVGAFAPAGLYVTSVSYDYDRIGVAALRKF